MICGLGSWSTLPARRPWSSGRVDIKLHSAPRVRRDVDQVAQSPITIPTKRFCSRSTPCVVSKSGLRHKQTQCRGLTAAVVDVAGGKPQLWLPACESVSEPLAALWRTLKDNAQRRDLRTRMRRSTVRIRSPNACLSQTKSMISFKGPCDPLESVVLGQCCRAQRLVPFGEGVPDCDRCTLKVADEREPDVGKFDLTPMQIP
jgi:hypothetical protein